MSVTGITKNLEALSFTLTDRKKAEELPRSRRLLDTLFNSVANRSRSSLWRSSRWLLSSSATVASS